MCVVKASSTAEKEYKYLDRLRNHRSICEVYESGYLDNAFCFSMARYPWTLQDRIQAGDYTELQISEWMMDLAKGLNKLHELEIMHRDLNPRNLFIDKQGNLRIGDFGIAGEKQISDTLTGTPGYVASEVYSTGGYSLKVDMWSVGCILLELLTKDQDYKKNYHERMKSMPKSYSQGWTEIVGGLLEKDPTSRMSAADLEVALLKIQLDLKKSSWNDQTFRNQAKDVAIYGGTTASTLAVGYLTTLPTMTGWGALAGPVLVSTTWFAVAATPLAVTLGSGYVVYKVMGYLLPKK